MGKKRRSFGPQDRRADPSKRSSLENENGTSTHVDPRMPAEHSQGNQRDAANREDASGDQNRHVLNEVLIGRWTRILGISTIVLAVATAISVVVAGFSAYYLSTTDESIHKTLIIGQRAFVHLEGISFEAADNWVTHRECNGALCVYNVPRNEGKMIRSKFSITNAGNTPTKHLRMMISCQTIQHETQLKDAFDLLKWDDWKVIERSIGAKQTVTLSIDECNFKGMTALLDKQMRVVRAFLLGEIDYEDWAAPGHPHRTRFAHEMVVTSAGKEPDFQGFGAETMPVGRNNCTDEDCPE